VEWIHLAQGRDRWRPVVNAVMNLQVLAPRVSSCSVAEAGEITKYFILLSRGTMLCEISLYYRNSI
jgi:hypothetical protein